MKTVLTIMILAAILFVSVQYGNAEKENVFYGLENLIDDPDSQIKFYKSGGFSLKNYELSIAIYAHPVDKTEMFKFTVIENGKVSRFIASIEEEIEPIIDVEPVVPLVTIYPKSSIGTDITNWDIPIDTARSYEKESSISVNVASIDTLFIGREYTIQISVIDEYNQGIMSVIDIDISRDSETVKTLSGTTTSLGVWNAVINVNSDKFAPGFCYNVSIIAVSGNYTNTVNEDFIVVSTAKYWDSSAEPIDADSHCNK